MKTPLYSWAAGPGLLLALALAASAQPSSPPVPDSAGARDGADYSSWDRAQGDRVEVMSSNHIAPDERIRGDVRAIMGSNTVAGSVSHDVVAVMGSDVIDGSVGHDVVAVMGSVVVNGTVGHNVRAVMGNVTLGPNSVVRGDVVTVGGVVTRSPGAIVHGRIVSQSMGAHGSPWGPSVTWRHEDGRSDWAQLVHNFLVTWRWVFTLIFLGFYALVALVFPGPIRRCGDILVQRPALTVLVSFAALLAVPLVFLLLLVTIIGIPVAILLLPCALMICLIVGKAGLYGLVGRSISSDRLHPAGAVLLGGALCAVFYFIPILGILLSIFVSLLGFGCGLTALLTRTRGTPPPLAAGPAPMPPAPAPAPVPVVEAPPPAAQAFTAPPPPAVTPDPSPGIVAGAPAVPTPAVPVYSAALPRAGFWLRMGALFIDSVIVSAACGSLLAPHDLIREAGFHLAGVNWMLPLAIYGAIMWKFKGTTIGGMICGLRVVRLDGKAITWETAIVRALACFLSTFLWLGFIWIAFDAEKQSWHDKIAGTVVVRTKGVSLV
jgi:uncharacterized RDD family membrane protein YckC